MNKKKHQRGHGSLYSVLFLGMFLLGTMHSSSRWQRYKTMILNWIWNDSTEQNETMEPYISAAHIEAFRIWLQTASEEEKKAREESSMSMQTPEGSRVNTQLQQISQFSMMETNMENSTQSFDSCLDMTTSELDQREPVITNAFLT